MTSLPLWHRSISRRRVLASAGAAASVTTLIPSPFVHAAPALKQVSMTLDWVFQGPNSGFMLAHDKGFYEQAGLDVSITAGKGSVSTAQLVASRATQFGFSDGYVVGSGVAKGMGIKSIGSVFRRNPAAVVVLADSAIKAPKDLEGKTIAITAGSAQFQQWPAFAKGAGRIQIHDLDLGGVEAGADLRQGAGHCRLRAGLRAGD